MRIWDTFLFNGEDGLLGLRRGEIAGLAHHVRITGDRTHSGAGQAPHGDVVVQLGTLGAFEAECRQRAAVDELAAEHRDDLFLHGDVDEIPRAFDVAKAADEYRRPVRLRGDLHQLRLDWWLPGHADAAVHPFAGPVLASGRDIIAAGGVLNLRRDTTIDEIHHSGWHLQWVMSPAECVRKVETFSHREFDLPRYRDESFWVDLADRGVDPLERWQLQPAPLSALPSAVQRNPEAFAHLMRPVAA